MLRVQLSNDYIKVQWSLCYLCMYDDDCITLQIQIYVNETSIDQFDRITIMILFICFVRSEKSTSTNDGF